MLRAQPARENPCCVGPWSTESLPRESCQLAPGLETVKLWVEGLGKAAQGAGAPASQTYELFWHGDQRVEEPRRWLIQDLIPETGSGLVSGQWGTGKPFVTLDLSASVMTSAPFA